MADKARALAEVACDVLQRMIRELLARKAGGHLVEARLREVDLHLPVTLLGPDGDPAALSETLVGAVEAVLDDAILQATAFQPGHAFCHRCGQASCGHSRPPSCRHVFVGYAPTGTPLWQDFAQHCLEARHPEVDRLYEDPPAFLTLVQAGDGLGARLLQAFRSPVYELRGQLLAGFFRVRTREEEGRGVLALTFQVVASRSARGAPHVALNILGVAPGGDDLETLWERYREIPWRRAARWAQSILASLRPGAPARGGNPDDAGLDRRVEGVLRGMARRLERDQRASARRTLHAEDRHESGRRPTRQALDDARVARADAVLVDERTGARVVLGDRGRTHFFTAEGRLVSSVRYSREAVERKRKIGLWREASPEETLGLRRRLLAEGGGEPPGDAAAGGCAGGRESV